MNHRWIRISFVIGLILSSQYFPVSTAKAEDIYEVVFKKKQETKKQTRSGWNLSDWLVQRDRHRIQDLWLAMHTPVPYEFVFSASYRWLNDTKNQADHRYSFYAFARLFGFGLEQETEPHRINALFLVRIFGLYDQGTNITLHGGFRIQNEPVYFRSGFYGVSTNLFLARFFGLEGSLRYYTKATANSMGEPFKGVVKEANMFIDYKFARVFFGYLNTPMDPGRGVGYQVGTRLYF